MSFQVPIINFKSDSCEEQMYNAYTTAGFAVFTNVYDEWLSEFQDWKYLTEEFFQLPLDVKKKYVYNGVKGSSTCRAGWGEMGYIQSRDGDSKESYNWIEPARMQEQYWPTEIPKFQSLAQSILQISQRLSYQFFNKFESIFKHKKGYLIDKHMSGYVNMRMFHYPAHEGQEEHESGGEHTDYGSITLLFRFDDVGGLQVQDRETDEWIDVPIIKNSTVLNIGDMFQRWSNDTLKSTNHRVVNTVHAKSRYSMPYFIDPGYNVLIKNFTNDPDKHSPITTDEYFKQTLAQHNIEQSWEQQIN